MQVRPPIIVVMGHVDHGKTTLLDYIRKTNIAGKAASKEDEPRPVAGREAGGITQSIGAYEIEHTPANSAETNSAPSTRKITFIDTPGHEAFSKMRARGAEVADLGILVVAADEGLKPQAKEAIAHLKTAKLPFIVAINKIDKNNSDPERIKKELADAGVMLEGTGGDVSWQTVSAKTGEGVNELLDLILLSAELLDLKYSPDAQAKGVIIEAKVDHRKGLIAIGILKNGVLKTGEKIFTASASGKIKLLKNFQGKPVDCLEPSAPALIFGFESLPQTGEEFKTAGKNELITILKKLPTVVPAKEITKKSDASKNPKIILKADNSGSLEALIDLIAKLPGELKFEIMETGIGNIKENDIKFASAAQAAIAGFRVGIDKAAENIAKTSRVNIITSEIIYDLLKSLERQLKEIELVIGSELEVLAVFGKPKPAGGSGKKQVVGGKAVRGLIKNKSEFEILRNGKPLGFGRLKNLQQNKLDVNEINVGQEAGMMVESDVIIKEKDILKF
ncbi:MAG: GTP-binding protein [Candidatus Brennerbacteria bacterium]|nr:GTP-binding protein [Candidatus Brennerbacteria bacterium]